MLSKKECLFLADLVEDAARVVSNQGCTDIDQKTIDLLSKEEAAILVEEWYKWNGEQEGA